MRATRAIALSVLLVVSSVMVGVGPGLVAAQSGATTYEYTGAPETLVVDTSDLTDGTQVTVEYSTRGVPGQDQVVLARETYNTANIESDEILFANLGAYESVNVTVTDYSGGEPKFDTISGLDSSTRVSATSVGSTGADDDLQCGLPEKISVAVLGGTQLDCEPRPGTTTANTTGLDAQQTEIELYQTAQNGKAGTENTLTVFSNYLQDTETQAKIIGKNAYIRALNQGQSESAARTAAKSAVADYYSKKQVNLARSWNTAVNHWLYLHSTATSDSGVTSSTENQTNSFVGFDFSTGGSYQAGKAVEYRGDGATSYTLVNDSTVSSKTVDVFTTSWLDNTHGYSGTSTITMTSTDSDLTVVPNEGAYWSRADAFVVRAPTSDYSKVRLAPWDRYRSHWNQIQTENQDVQADMDTLVNKTYSEYQAGDINTSDLVDPYLADSRLSPSNSQTWAAAQLSMLGVGQPADFDQLGAFNISVQNGPDYRGVLLSQSGVPGGFENGTSYDPATINGTQYVVTPNDTVELTNVFTITSIEDTDGEPVQNVTIETTDYTVSNVTDLQQQYQDLAEDYAELEARQQQLQSIGGAGGLLGASVDPTMVLIVVALVLALGIINN